MRLPASLACLFLLTHPAPAQELAAIRLAEPVDHIDEHFDRSGPGANVSGGVIVGALLGGMVADGFPADEIRIATPEERVLLCMRALSRDGRYSARTRYRLTGLVDGRDGTLLRPFTAEAEGLRQYDDDEVAVIAMPADGEDQCRSGEPRLFPRVIAGLPLGETGLLLQVNTAGRGVAWIEPRDGTRADCRPVEGDLAIGFDMICELRVSVGLELAWLDFDLSIDDGLQVQQDRYTLAIPAHDPNREDAQ